MNSRGFARALPFVRSWSLTRTRVLPKGHPPLIRSGGTGHAEETVPQNLRVMEKLKMAVVSLSGGTLVNRKSVSPKRAESVADARGR